MDSLRERLLNVQNCTNMRMRRAARAVSDFYNVIMEPAGLHGNQFTLLVPLFLRPELTINQLSEYTGLDRTTLARNLKVLEEHRLIALRPGQDQRTRVIQLTELGRDSLLEALPHWEQAQQQVAAALGAGHFAELSDSLDKLEELLD